MIEELSKFRMRKSYNIRKKDKFVAYFTKEAHYLLNLKKLKFPPP